MTIDPPDWSMTGSPILTCACAAVTTSFAAKDLPLDLRLVDFGANNGLRRSSESSRVPFLTSRVAARDFSPDFWENTPQALPVVKKQRKSCVFTRGAKEIHLPVAE